MSLDEELQFQKSRSWDISLGLVGNAHDTFRRVFSTQPHQEEITKVDDKHGRENILLKGLKYQKILAANPHLSSEAFEQISYFLSREIRIVT